MERKDIRIMIVDDDIALGKALVKVLEQIHLRADHFAKPDDALKAARLNSYSLFLIDCLLPKTNGVELAQRLQEGLLQSSKVILMSGVFKDRSFIKEATAKTEAVIFLQKPFDNEAFVHAVEEALKDSIAEPPSALFELLTRPKMKPRDLKKRIESIEQVSGYELPFVYTSIMEAGLSGHINLVDEQGMVSGITFCNGTIQKVDIPDNKTYIGELLVEHGFISAVDVNESLKSTNERRMGQHLVESNLVSPHAISIVMREQMSLRLAMTIRPEHVQVNFAQEDVPAWEPFLTQQELVPHLNDWLISKFKLEWLKSYYMEWMEHKLQPSGCNIERSVIASSLLTQQIPDLMQFLLSVPNLAAAVDRYKHQEDEFYRCLHFLILTRQLCFDPNKEVVSWDFQFKRLQRIAKEIEGKNYLEIFETFGASPRAKPQELLQVYRELSKILHPDKISQEAPPELTKLASSVYAQVTSAYKVMTDETARNRYLKELEAAQTQKHLDAESKIEEAKAQLHRGQIARAKELFEKCMTLIDPTPELMLYHLWAQLKLYEAGQLPADTLNKVEGSILKIPPEDRHSATYFFVRGLIEKLSGDKVMAIRNFEHAAHLNTALMEAKRELQILKMKKPTDPENFSLLHSDLSVVISKFFKS